MAKMRINIEEPTESYWKTGTLRDVWEREPVIQASKGRTTVYQGYKNYFKMVVKSMFLGGLIGFLGAEATNNHQEARKLDVTPQSVFIDLDDIPDLVIGERIFFANRTKQGIEYRRLGNPDIYRIK